MIDYDDDDYTYYDTLCTPPSLRLVFLIASESIVYF